MWLTCRPRGTLKIDLDMVIVVICGIDWATITADVCFDGDDAL